MLPLLLTISLLSFSLLFFSLHRRRRRNPPPPLADIVRTLTGAQNLKSVEIWPADEPAAAGDDECERRRRRKKRGKKKRCECEDSVITEGDSVITEGDSVITEGDSVITEGDSVITEAVKKEGEVGTVKRSEDLVCLYPFTSASSATQRRIKQQYDELVKCHESNGLTLLQVGQFVNCLVEARNELKQKSEVIHRKFTITKALLFKADRSSFDRLRQQLYKLELEQKRLEEDASVYNWLQQQLKLSPAYKKMLEIGAYMESNLKAIEATEDSDFDKCDISFEELLAQEKKDSFWQKKGRPKLGPD